MTPRICYVFVTILSTIKWLLPGVDLALVVSPYTELPHCAPGDPALASRLDTAATALLCLLRCWPGHCNTEH